MKINYIKEIDDSKVYDVAEKTPISLLNKISTKYNNTVFLKREDLQPIFSFKCRGAYNKISSLSSEQISKGIIAVKRCSNELSRHYEDWLVSQCKQINLADRGVFFSDLWVVS